MPPLSATTRPVDRARATRCVIAWLADDKPALDYVLAEVMADPVGTPGLIFSLIEAQARLGHNAAPNYVDQLRALLLPPTGDDGQGDE